MSPRDASPSPIPIVNYLRLDADRPRLCAQECTACGARYLANRIACAACGAREFTICELPSTGTIGSFSIIHRAGPGVAVPFVSAIVDLADGTSVKTNVVGCAPDPDHVKLRMPVRLTTFAAGTDDDGVSAIAFAFEPITRDDSDDPQREATS